MARGTRPGRLSKDEGTSNSTSSNKSKVEGTEKKRPQNPLRRSERIAKYNASGSKMSNKSPSPLMGKQKVKEVNNEENLVESVAKEESEDKKLDAKSDGSLKKRKRLDARSYKALLQPQVKKLKSSENPCMQKKVKEVNNEENLVESIAKEESKDKKLDAKSDGSLKKRKRLDARSYRALLKPQAKKLKSSGLLEDGHGCSERKEEELRWQYSNENFEEAVEGSSSNSIDLAELTLGIEGKGKTPSTKHEFFETNEPRTEDSSSQSKCGGTLLQSSPVGSTSKENSGGDLGRQNDVEGDRIDAYGSDREEIRTVELVESSSEDNALAGDLYPKCGALSATPSNIQILNLESSTADAMLSSPSLIEKKNLEQCTVCSKLQSSKWSSKINSKDIKSTTTLGNALMDSFNLFRSTRETSMERMNAFSSLQKSGMPENQTPTSSNKRKMKGTEKKRPQNPLRRSERIEKCNASGSKMSNKSPSPLMGKKKVKEVTNEENLVESVAKEESEDKKLDAKSDGSLKKRKRLDARSYRALLKPQVKKLKSSDATTMHPKDDASRGDKIDSGACDSTGLLEDGHGCSGRKEEELRSKIDLIAKYCEKSSRKSTGGAESIPIGPETVVSQSNNMNEWESVEPGGASAKVPASLSPGETGNMPTGTEDPTPWASRMNSARSWSDAIVSRATTAVDSQQIVDAEISDGARLISPKLQSHAKFSACVNASTSSACQNIMSSNQEHFICEHERPAASVGVVSDQGLGSSQQFVLPSLHSVDIVHSKLEPANQNATTSDFLDQGSGSSQQIGDLALHSVDVVLSQPINCSTTILDSLQLQLPPSTDMPLVGHGRGSTSPCIESQKEPHSHVCGPSQQTEAPLQQPNMTASVPIGQSNQLVSQLSQPLVHPSALDASVPPERLYSGDLRSTNVQSESGSYFLQLFATAPLLPPQGLQPEPLKNELTRLRMHQDSLIKLHDDKKLHLELECAQELEMVRKKYDALLKDAETEFLQSKEIIERIYKGLIP